MQPHDDALMSPDFRALVRRTLEFLARQVPMGAWLFTRVNGEDWVILDVVGDGYDITAGDVLPWADSFCNRMVAGEGPRIAADAQAVPAYAEQPVFDLTIGRYCGVPVAVEGMGLFGTLCGIDPEPGSVEMLAAGPWVINAAEMLSSALALDLERDRLAHELDRAKQAARTDGLTGMGNQRGFEHAVQAADSRSRRYGSTAAVVVVDLDDLNGINTREGEPAGDELIRRTAEVLHRATRTEEPVFRTGGDRFAVVVPDATPTAGHELRVRIREELQHAGIAAALGVRCQQPGRPLATTVDEATTAMLADKRERSG